MRPSPAGRLPAHGGGQPAHLPRQQRVTDERHDVEQRVRGHQRPDPPPPPVEAARRPRPSPCCRRSRRCPGRGGTSRAAPSWPPARAIGVQPNCPSLRSRYPTTMTSSSTEFCIAERISTGYFHHTSGSASGTTVRLNPTAARRQVEGEPGAADHRRDRARPGRGRARAGCGRSRSRAARAPSRSSKMRDQRDGHQGGRDPEQLPGEVEPGPAGRVRAVEGGRLVLQPARLGHRSDEADQRGHPARAERERQHEQGLVPQDPARPGRSRGTGSPPTASRLRLHTCLQLSGPAEGPSSPDGGPETSPAGCRSQAAPSAQRHRLRQPHRPGVHRLALVHQLAVAAGGGGQRRVPLQPAASARW